MQHDEDLHQIALFEWSELYTINYPYSPAHGHKIRPYMFAIPNGGNRNAREAKRLKRLGVTPGIMDIMIAIPTEYYNGLFIEMKRPATPFHPKGYASKEQKEKILLFNNMGYKAVIAYGSKNATEWIVDYLK